MYVERIFTALGINQKKVFVEYGFRLSKLKICFAVSLTSSFSTQNLLKA
jgi:hypothetical protein